MTNDFFYKNLPILSNKILSKIKSSLDSQLPELTVSLDLGITEASISLDPDAYTFSISSDEKIHFPESFDETERICYFIDQQQIFPIKLFSESTNFYYKLVPTSWRPLLRISATPMHKKPFLDALEQLEFRGFVLDGGTGLGYSAIIASKTATRVFSIEWDENVIEIATYNPHSKDLFLSTRIELVIGDITKEVLRFDDNFFDNLIQDGGMPKSSGTFFSLDHCRQLHRVLKPGGVLIFYLPQHGKTKGRDFGAEHLDRLKKAGFFLKKRDSEGSYAILYKGGN